MIASEGPAVDLETANAAPIVAPTDTPKTPTLNYQPVEGLPDALQPSPGDVLLGKAFWPWQDLGAQSIPEQWLYMSRKVQGVIAQLAVQTPAGPKLVNADPNGNISTASPRKRVFKDSIPAGGNYTRNFMLDSTAHGITLNFIIAGPVSNISGWSILGVDTGKVYAQGVPNLDAATTYWIPLPVGDESAWQLLVAVVNGAGPISVIVSAIYDASAVQIATQTLSTVTHPLQDNGLVRIHDEGNNFGLTFDPPGYLPVSIRAIDGVWPVRGRKNMAGSMPVVPASDWPNDVSDRPGRMIGQVSDTLSEFEDFPLAAYTTEQVHDLSTEMEGLPRKPKAIVIFFTMQSAGTGTLRFLVYGARGAFLSSRRFPLVYDSTALSGAAWPTDNFIIIGPGSVSHGAPLSIFGAVQTHLPNRLYIDILKSDASAWTFECQHDWIW